MARHRRRESSVQHPPLVLQRGPALDVVLGRDEVLLRDRPRDGRVLVLGQFTEISAERFLLRKPTRPRAVGMDLIYLEYREVLRLSKGPNTMSAGRVPMWSKPVTIKAAVQEDRKQS